MFRFLIGKFAYLVPTFIGITIVAFGFVRVLPGDPVLLMAGERGLSAERHAALLARPPGRIHVPSRSVAGRRRRAARAPGWLNAARPSAGRSQDP